MYEELNNILIARNFDTDISLLYYYVEKYNTPLIKLERNLYRETDNVPAFHTYWIKKLSVLGKIIYAFQSEGENLRVFIANEDDKVIININIYRYSDTISVVIIAPDFDIADDYFIDVIKLTSFSIYPVTEEASYVKFASISNGGIEYTTKEMDSEPFDDIRQNYTLSVQESIDSLIKRIPHVDNGIVAIHGKPGTGKTYLIRSLLSELEGINATICMPATAFLENANNLRMVVQYQHKPVIILEDLGDMFAQSLAHTNHDPFNVLLNFTDGLYGLLGNVVFILTFNVDSSKLDKALLRPGRCIADIRVDPLKQSEARNLLPGIDLPKKEYSLAEIYAMKNDSQVITNIEEKGKVGFIK